ncbi:MAG TPA: TetR family transcriptional regulator [Actinopolymorphaceae bacterium]
MSGESPVDRRRARRDPDRTARARIRDAAIEHFATRGFAAAKPKDIAADAGVSAPLVFGSKEGLRIACDQYVADLVAQQKTDAMEAGTDLDPLQAVREAYGGTPVMRYLATTIADGSPRVDDLIDELIEDSQAYLAHGVENGVLAPAENLRERAIVLFLWQLGSLVLHRQAERLLGIDLLDNRDGSALEWVRINTEILAEGVIRKETYEKWEAMRTDGSER